VVPDTAPAVTTPDELTVAIAGTLLLHVPPTLVLLSALLAVMQALSVPVIGLGDGFTTSTDVVLQPVDVSVNVMTEVPELTPVATPVVAPIVATDKLLLAHVPVPVELLSVVDISSHTLNVPVIVAGNGFTVTVLLIVQPVDVSVNVIFAVPAALPVTTPVAASTLAIPKLLLDHVPAPDVLVSEVLLPIHTSAVPVIALGWLTVIVLKTGQPRLVI
jgi:hypothetical protein